MVNTSTFNEIKLNSMPNGAMKACHRHARSVARLKDELSNPKRTLSEDKIKSIMAAHIILLEHCTIALGTTQ